MSQLTIRYDKETERCIRRLAKEEGLSLNQAAVRLLRRGAGLDTPAKAADVIGDGLDDLIGTWTDRHADQMRVAEKDFATVDDELWR